MCIFGWMTSCMLTLSWFLCHSWVKQFGGNNGLNAILQSLNFCYDRSVHCCVRWPVWNVTDCNNYFHSFIYFWHAPLWVHSARHRHQFPEWTYQERFNDFRSYWVVFIHIVQGHPDGLIQFSKGEGVKICLASDLSDIHALWPNRERCHAWTVAERCGCSVFHLTSSFHTWYCLIPNSCLQCFKTVLWHKNAHLTFNKILLPASNDCENLWENWPN